MSDEIMDWSGAPDQMVREVLVQGEKYLEAQVKCAVAGDQRATTFTGVLVTLTAAVIAAAIALWEKVGTDEIAGMLTMAAFLLAAALSSAWAARPIAFFLPGSRPDQWHEGRNEDFSGMLAGAVENVQLSIEENDKFMDRNADAFGASLALAVLSPAVGAFIWWFV